MREREREVGERREKYKVFSSSTMYDLHRQNTEVMMTVARRIFPSFPLPPPPGHCRFLQPLDSMCASFWKERYSRGENNYPMISYIALRTHFTMLTSRRKKRKNLFQRRPKGFSLMIT